MNTSPNVDCPIAALETWQLGYAPEDWSDLLRYLTNQKNHQPEEIEQAGLDDQARPGRLLRPLSQPLDVSDP